jgi:hypothetical protein
MFFPCLGKQFACNSALDGDGWSDSRRFRFISLERASGTHNIGALMVPTVELEALQNRWSSFYWLSYRASRCYTEGFENLTHVLRISRSVMHNVFAADNISTVLSVSPILFLGFSQDAEELLEHSCIQFHEDPCID